jgi:hypothetical protein
VYYENLATLQEEVGKKDDAIATWKTFLNYLDDPVIKDRIRSHLDKLEGRSATEAGPAAITPRTSAPIPSDDMQKGLRPDDRKQTKVVNTKPVDISNDFQDINTDQPKLDLKDEAKKKAAKK